MEDEAPDSLALGGGGESRLEDADLDASLDDAGVVDPSRSPSVDARA